MLIRYGTGTSRGRIREQNEDSYTIVDCMDKGFMVFAVADGMGGMDNGDVASSTAVGLVEKNYSKCIDLDESGGGICTAIRALFNQINSEIITEANSRELVSGMGTTLSMCITSNGRMYIGHIGDSRVYIIRNGTVEQLTKDHSYVEDLIDSGRITREQARNHPDKHIITKALGLDRKIEVDCLEYMLEPGDRILLCSDGLTNELDDEEICKITTDCHEPGEGAAKLLEKANELGGRDNVTVLLVYIDQQPEE